MKFEHETKTNQINQFSDQNKQQLNSSSIKMMIPNSSYSKSRALLINKMNSENSRQDSSTRRRSRMRQQNNDENTMPAVEQMAAATKPAPSKIDDDDTCCRFSSAPAEATIRPNTNDNHQCRLMCSAAAQASSQPTQSNPTTNETAFNSSAKKITNVNNNNRCCWPTVKQQQQSQTKRLTIDDRHDNEEASRWPINCRRHSSKFTYCYNLSSATQSTIATILVTLATLLLITSSASFTMALDAQQQQLGAAKAEALISQVGAGSANVQTSKTLLNSGGDPSNPSVIVIKYANVTTRNDNQEAATAQDEESSLVDQTKLNVFQLHNEPLSVPFIESKFSHSIQLFDVSQNQLSTLSKDLFCPLSNEVRQLNISHNLLENFDCLGLISQAGQLCLSELRILDMSHNLVKHLPATGVATLHNLEVLNLSNNLIESLDELSLSSLFKLTKLDLSNNRIQQLPLRIFHKSTSMQVLRLQANHLQTSINQVFLSGLISLEELNLSFNNISHISDLAFLDKPNLTRVDLSHNQLNGLRQEALRVTQLHVLVAGRPATTVAASSMQQQQPSYKTRLHHNGQYAPPSASVNYPKQQQTATTSVEFYLSSNPFVCDCQLEWMRKYQPAFVSRRTLLSNNRINSQQHQADYLSLSDQLVQLQNDQPTVIQQQQHNQQTPTSDPNNNISENVQSSQQASSFVTSSSSSSANGGGHHYGRIADLEQIKCSPLYKRNSQIRQQRHQSHLSRAALPSGAENNNQHAHHHHSMQVHHPNNHLHHHHHNSNRMQTDLISSSSAHQQVQQQQNNMMIDLLTADSSNFLCRYKSHCFALCHCCEFDACDCEMICPTGCNCYYDSTWQTNIIDCSSNNHTVVPDRIPMDVSGLYLDGNNIDSLKPSNLIARKSLKTLYLNSSNLQFIANRTFNGLIELQTLYLNDNQLRSLNGYEFEPLAQLRALFLQSNRLDHISNQTFIYLRSLEILDLSNNRLTSINIDLFMSIGHHNIRLRQLSIAHNWWSCQCSSINRFRQILKQKFLLNGGVNIADKNQLRCYYNSTTVGPLILDSAAYGASSSSSGQPQQQPIFASFPQLASSSLSSQQLQLQQQQQLTEINQCSEMVEDRPDWLLDVNPPVIQPQTPSVINSNNNEFSSGNSNNEQMNEQNYQTETTNQIMGPANNGNNNNQLPPNGPYPGVISDQPIYGPPNMAPPMDIFGQPQQSYNGFNQQQHHQIQPHYAPANTMSLSAFLLLCALCICVIIIAISIFVFIRQQQQRFNHKRSSAASTTSGSSGASSAAAISALGPKIHHHTLGQASHHHHHHAHPHHHTLHQHHLIMGSNAQVVSTTGQHHQQQHSMQHNLSASSQSNIYAALVSPTTGNSTIVTNGSNGGGGSMFHHYHHRQPSNTASNTNNNLYSNSSTTASHHSKSSSMQQQLASNGNYSSAAAAASNHWQQQQQIYGQPSPFGHFENPYEASQSVTYKTSGGGALSGGVPNPTTGSLYNALASSKCQEVAGGGEGGVNISSDWIRLPKVKQFMSKLVNKSLALGGFRSGSGSRDELSAITSDKIYDAFLSYDKRDEPFVMQHLSAELEYGQPQYRVADRFRDLPLPSSAYIAEAITGVIGCSQRTIIVLTENYLTSDWCRYELQAALRESAIDKSHKIIAVVLDPNCLLEMDAEMRALLTNPSTQIVQPTAGQQQQLVQLDGSSGNGSPASEFQQQQQLIATLTNQSGGNQQICTQTTQLATSRITFINYNERKFWNKLKQMMPMPRPSTQTLTLTTKN